VVEEACVLLNKRDAELLSGLEDGHVVLAAAGSSDVLDARAGGAVDIVNEGELVRLVFVKPAEHKYHLQKRHWTHRHR
jgi:hypothetical protein